MKRPNPGYKKDQTVLIAGTGNSLKPVKIEREPRWNGFTWMYAFVGENIVMGEPYLGRTAFNEVKITEIFPFEGEPGYFSIDAFTTNDPGEEGLTIARVYLDNRVEYLDERAKTDRYAQLMISEITEAQKIEQPYYKIANDVRFDTLKALNNRTADLTPEQQIEAFNEVIKGLELFRDNLKNKLK